MPTNSLLPEACRRTLHWRRRRRARLFKRRIDREKFVTDPFRCEIERENVPNRDWFAAFPSGHFEFLGRMDGQISCAVSASSLAEIETAISCILVKAGVVLLREDAPATNG